MRVTATEAKNRFGAVCNSAKNAPVIVEKDGRIETVILSLEQFEALGNIKSDQSTSIRRKHFEERYGAWLNHQNTQFDEVGLWCDDLRVW
jgi:PHD/YefM family antitoxin component YafN of YafNO toxin-antitoxin module